jgi:hypothetical protein
VLYSIVKPCASNDLKVALIALGLLPKYRTYARLAPIKETWDEKLKKDARIFNHSWSYSLTFVSAHISRNGMRVFSKRIRCHDQSCGRKKERKKTKVGPSVLLCWCHRRGLKLNFESWAKSRSLKYEWTFFNRNGGGQRFVSSLLLPTCLKKPSVSVMVSMNFSRLIALLTSLLSYCAVPEHFSTPLYIAQEQGFFRDNIVNVELVCCPGK